MSRPPSYERVKAALVAYRSLGPEAREGWLSALRADEPALHAELASLLSADREEGMVVTGGLAGPLAELAPGSAPTSLPERIGPYRIVEVLGEGGMGVVYRAEQETPIRREVALKLVRAGLDTERVVARFDAERQALALMDHPGIARVLDAGADARGRPYFVMELVRGTPLTRWCDEHGLGVDARLDLFLRVCAAVQHAHQRGLIHRDLKPANILVTRRDQLPEPRVIDFGIAKAIAEPQGERLALTQEGQFLGTPEYMSPEQAGAPGAPVDVRTDVYSLGVILFELLTGSRPRAAAASGNPAPARETESERPSTRVTRLAPTSTLASASGGLDRLRRRLSGDLDTIVLMALRAEPDRRYGSVEALALDLRRHRDGLPVSARPDTARYRAGKFVGRHAVGVALALAGAVALAAVAAVSTVQSARVAVERDRALAAEQTAAGEARRARLEAATANRVTKLLTGLFEASDPAQAKGADPTAREILRRGEEKVTSDLRDEPEVQARLLSVIGQVHANLGDLPRAREFLERAIALQRPLHSEPDAEMAETLDVLGVVRHDQGDLAEAEDLARQALEARRRLFGERSSEVAQSLNAVAVDVGAQGRLAEAEPLFREALGILRETRGPDDPEVAWAINTLGQTVYRRGDRAAAVPLFREALDIQRRKLGTVHPDTAASLNNLGGAQMELGDLAGAEATFREALSVYLQLYGENHAGVARARGNLGTALRRTGQLAEAEALQRQALEGFRRLLGPRHAHVGRALSGLASTLAAAGRTREAEPLAVQALSIMRESLGAGHPSTANMLLTLGRIREGLGDRAGAVRDVREGIERLEAALGAEHPDVVGGRAQLDELEGGRAGTQALRPPASP
jgi:serine/threonine protein kinase/tetratricopeptide (TPR) repeat protein